MLLEGKGCTEEWSHARKGEGPQEEGVVEKGVADVTKSREPHLGKEEGATDQRQVC